VISYNLGKFNRGSGFAAPSVFLDGAAAPRFATDADLVKSSNISVDGVSSHLTADGDVSRARCLDGDAKAKMQTGVSIFIVQKWRNPKHGGGASGGFNRGRFNLGKFNRRSDNDWAVRFVGSAGLKCRAFGALSVSRGVRGDASLQMTANGRLSQSKAFSADFLLKFSAKGRISQAHPLAGAADWRLGTDGRVNAAKSYLGTSDLRLETAGRVNKSVAVSGDSCLKLKAFGRVNVTRGFVGASDWRLSAGGHLSWAVNFAQPIDLFLETEGAVIRSQPFEGASDWRIFTRSAIVRARHYSGKSPWVLRVSRTPFFTFVYHHIELTGLTLRPGEELVVDTDRMTITINRQNAIRFLTADSEFFLLHPSPSAELTFPNEITYTGTPAANAADIRILWKDVFL